MEGRDDTKCFATLSFSVQSLLLPPSKGQATAIKGVGWVSGHRSTKASAVKYSIKDGIICLALLQDERSTPPSRDVLTAHTLFSGALPITSTYPGHLMANTEVPATWKWGGKAHQDEILASTLMAQRPMARTALRTKSTSTSVAYSLSSASTCGDTTAMSDPGDTQRTAHPHRWCCLDIRRRAGCSFTAITHIQPNSAISSPSETHWFGYTWCVTQTGVGYTWCRLDKVKKWSGLDYFQFPWSRAGEKISPAKLKGFYSFLHWKRICCVQSSRQEPFLISFSVLRWTFGSPVNPNGRCRGDLRTLWNIYTQISNRMKILPLLKTKIYYFVSVFLLMETDEGLNPGPAGISQTFNWKALS